MPTATPSQNTRQREDRLSLVVTVFLFAVSFVSGYATCTLLTEKRIWAEADLRARDFLSGAIHAGILVVDHKRIEEWQQQNNGADAVGDDSGVITNQDGDAIL